MRPCSGGYGTVNTKAAWLALNGWVPCRNTVGKPSMLNGDMAVARYLVHPIYRMMPVERVQSRRWIECSWENIHEVEIEELYEAVQRGVCSYAGGRWSSNES